MSEAVDYTESFTNDNFMNLCLRKRKKKIWKSVEMVIRRRQFVKWNKQRDSKSFLGANANESSILKFHFCCRLPFRHQFFHVLSVVDGSETKTRAKTLLKMFQFMIFDRISCSLPCVLLFASSLSCLLAKVSSVNNPELIYESNGFLSCCTFEKTQKRSGRNFK